MLPIKNRLKKREDFSIIFSKGMYSSAGNVTVKYLRNSLSTSRIGFPVGKNYSKKAVIRNRARRILRASCAQLLPHVVPGFDIIVLIKPSYQNPGFKDTMIELEKVFHKANLLM